MAELGLPDRRRIKRMHGISHKPTIAAGPTTDPRFNQNRKRGILPKPKPTIQPPSGAPTPVNTAPDVESASVAVEALSTATPTTEGTGTRGRRKPKE